MKQAFVLSEKELSLLRRGKKIEISFGGEIIQLQAEKDPEWDKKAAAMAHARRNRKPKRRKRQPKEAE